MKTLGKVPGKEEITVCYLSCGFLGSEILPHLIESITFLEANIVEVLSMCPTTSNSPYRNQSEAL